MQALKNTKQKEHTVKASNIDMSMPTFSGDEKKESPKSCLKHLNMYELLTNS